MLEIQFLLVGVRPGFIDFRIRRCEIDRFRVNGYGFIVFIGQVISKAGEMVKI